MSEPQNQNDFDFELVSPERKLISEKSWQVTIPGFEGDFGVRAGHSSLVSSIRPGVVEVIAKQGDQAQKLFIAGGFADVTESNCTILAEEAYKVDEFNQEEIETDITALQEKLDTAKDDIEKARFTKQLEVARAKLTAITGSLAA